MSLKLAGDLVTDVLRAADPGRTHAAARKLAAGKATADFGAALRQADTGRVRDLPGDMIAGVLGAAKPEAAAAGFQKLAAGSAGPKQDLEAFMLGRSIESMMPKNESGVFGDKIAGDMWRSLLADELGKSLSAGGGIGIAGLMTESDRSEDDGARAEPAAGASWPYFQHQPYLPQAS